MKSWKELEVFKHTDLEDSFVIGWESSDETFFIDLEISLWPGHAEYEQPQKNEFTCYKKARLIFRNPRNLSGLLAMSDVVPTSDPSGTPDYDTIEDFNVGDFEYHLSGEFGNVTFSAADWNFKIAC